jgi:IS605 OrfB family transposase
VPYLVGEYFAGRLHRNRRRRNTARKQYQRKGTRNARRRLRKMAGRQRKFQTQENHRISKRLVAKAKARGVGLALEDLQGIGGRLQDTVTKSFRRRLGNWAFAQLLSFVQYKARLAGVPVVTLDPRNSSRTCSACGHCEKGNRKTQDRFACLHCGFSANADLNAALNLRAWAACRPAPKAAG